MKKVLSIAGSSTSGGAGLQADLKTYAHFGVYGLTAITTIVAQDPTDWSHRVFPIELDVLRAQLDTIFGGVGVDAVKTGMLGSVELIHLVAEYIDKFKPKMVVVDPVIACKGADRVMNTDVANALREIMVPRAFVLTPNLLEASILTGIDIKSTDDMQSAAKALHIMGAKHVVIKGGSRLGGSRAIDIYFDGKNFTRFENDIITPSQKLAFGNNHGAGCTFAASIAAQLAKGIDVAMAIKNANTLVNAGIRNGFKLNEFVGCLNIL